MMKLTFYEKRLIVFSCLFTVSVLFFVALSSFFMASLTTDKGGTVTFISPRNDFMNTISFVELYQMLGSVSVASCLLGVAWAVCLSVGWRTIKSFKEPT